MSMDTGITLDVLQLPDYIWGQRSKVTTKYIFSCHESNFLSRCQAMQKEAFPGQLILKCVYTELTHPFLSTIPHSSAFPFYSEHVAVSH